MTGELTITPRSITADASDGQITLSLRESQKSVVVARFSEAQAREVIFSLEDVLKSMSEHRAGGFVAHRRPVPSGSAQEE